MSLYADLQFVPAGGHGGNRSLTTCVVIHATDNTAAASNEANYARTRDDGISAHFYSDETMVIQALDTDLVAYGCYPTGNSRSVQFELVGRSNQISDATMRRIAPVVARVCAQYGIPVQHVTPAQLRARVKGICGHGDVTAAWGEGDHTDPGDQFPWATFISYVAAGSGEEDTVIGSQEVVNAIVNGSTDKGFLTGKEKKGDNGYEVQAAAAFNLRLLHAKVDKLAGGTGAVIDYDRLASAILAKLGLAIGAAVTAELAKKSEN